MLSHLIFTLVVLIFYNAHNQNGTTVIDKDTKPLLRLSNTSTAFNVIPTFNVGAVFSGNTTFNSETKFTKGVNIQKPLSLSSGNYNTDTTQVLGQGSILMWNTVQSGGARTELVNVDPVSDGRGGFDFFNVKTGDTVSGTEPMLRLKKQGTYFNVNPLFNLGLSVAKGQQIWFANDKSTAALAIFSDENGDMMLGTQIENGANVRGVNGYYGKAAILTNSISAPKIIGQQFHGELSTPSSSSATCSAGDFKDDANYHYVCVATNKWKRVSLSDF